MGGLEEGSLGNASEKQDDCPGEQAVGLCGGDEWFVQRGGMGVGGWRERRVLRSVAERMSRLRVCLRHFSF